MGEKKSTGPNARPMDETIAQTGPGLPDDSSALPEGAEDADEEKAGTGLDRLERGENTSDSKED